MSIHDVAKSQHCRQTLIMMANGSLTFAKQSSSSFSSPSFFPSFYFHFFFFALASFFVMEVFTSLTISMLLLQCFLWLLWRLLYVIIILCCCYVTCSWSFPSMFYSCSCSKILFKILGLLLQCFSWLLWKPFLIISMCGFVTLLVVVPFLFFPSLAVLQRFY